MYAVIFRAQINIFDEQYHATGTRLRDLALNEYGCLEFISSTQGEIELAISYWPDLDSIRRWKANAEHVQAQQLGRQKWYKSYQVEIVEVVKQYHSTDD